MLLRHSFLNLEIISLMLSYASLESNQAQMIPFALQTNFSAINVVVLHQELAFLGDLLKPDAPWGLIIGPSHALGQTCNKLGKNQNLQQKNSAEERILMLSHMLKA